MLNKKEFINQIRIERRLDKRIVGFLENYLFGRTKSSLLLVSKKRTSFCKLCFNRRICSSNSFNSGNFLEVRKSDRDRMKQILIKYPLRRIRGNFLVEYFDFVNKPFVIYHHLLPVPGCLCRHNTSNT